MTKFSFFCASVMFLTVFCICNNPADNDDWQNDESFIIDNEPFVSDDESMVIDDNKGTIVDDTINKNTATEDFKPLFIVDIASKKNNIWKVTAELTKDDRIFSSGISGATITVNLTCLVEDTFHKGVYSGNLDSLTSGQTISVKLTSPDVGTHTFDAKMPPFFERTPSLTGSKVDGKIKFIWESVHSDEYQLFKRIENGYGTTVELNVDVDFTQTDTVYVTTLSDLLTGYFSMTPEPRYFTLWVCPSSKTRLTSEFSPESYLRLSGKTSNGITNKSAQ